MEKQVIIKLKGKQVVYRTESGLAEIFLPNVEKLTQPEALEMIDGALEVLSVKSAKNEVAIPMDVVVQYAAM